MRFIQLNSSLTFGDAITQHAFEIDNALREWGFETYIYADSIDKNFAKFGYVLPDHVDLDKHYNKFKNNREDILFYHYSHYCENVMLYKESKNKKIFEYHNITPYQYFRNYDITYEISCIRGRRELFNLHNCDFAVGDSEYNMRELLGYNFDKKNTGVLPIFTSFEKFENAKINKKIVEQFNDGSVNFLFVGRIAPNKKIEDIIKCFYYYHRFVNPHSRLFLSGPSILKKYDAELKSLVHQLDLGKSVIFTERISVSDLKTYYTLSHAFLCMSEHEGFCVPLLESMYFKLPILAYNSTAIPYTLDKSGILINKKQFAEIAELMNVVVENSQLRSQLIRKQQERLKDFSPENIKSQLKDVIDRVL